MKYLMMMILCVMITGCVTKENRFNPNATIKGKSAFDSGDNLGNRIDAAQKRIKRAVEEGKMTPEEGKEMLDALKKRARKGRNKK